MRFICLFYGVGDYRWRMFKSRKEAEEWGRQVVKAKKKNFPNNGKIKYWVYLLYRGEE